MSRSRNAEESKEKKKANNPSHEEKTFGDKKSVLIKPNYKTKAVSSESRIEIDHQNSLKSCESSNNPVVCLRKREVALAKVSLCIVVIFFICHGIRIVPNTFEMVQTYMAVSFLV